MRPRKKVKLEDIAKEMGVSIVTVSNALSGRRGVSDELREKIIQKAGEMGYETVSGSRKSGTDQKKILAVCFENTEGVIPHSTRISLEALKIAAGEGGIAFRYHAFSRDARNFRRVRKMPEDQDVDGIIAVGEMSSEELALLCHLYELPMAAYGFFDAHVPIDYVMDDSFHGIGWVVRGLYERGHRNMAFVMPDYREYYFTDRMLGFYFASRVMGLIPPGEASKMEYANRNSFTRLIADIRNGSVPDAVLCADDYTAERVIRRLSEEGLRVPEDVSVTGYRRVSERPEAPDLTSMEVDERDLAAKCVDILRKRMNGKTEIEGVRMIPGTLYEGNTVADRTQ